VPLLDSDASAALEQVEQLLDACDAVRWQLDGALKGVNHPTQDCLEGCPAGIAFQHLFDGCGLLARAGVGGVEWPEDVIQGI
jgi:hypothetical protein